MNNRTVTEDYPDVEMAVPAPRRWARRASVAWRFFISLIVFILLNNFSPYGAYDFLNDGLQICGAGFIFFLIFTYGYLWGVRNMEEVVDNPID